MHQQHTLCAAFLSFLVFSVGAAWADPPKLPVPAFDQSAVGQRGYFYVGGQYIGEDGKNIMRRQVYVEVVAPKDVRHLYPLVLIHGNAQTATNWMGTPDGRKGWADFFVEQGYIVYMMEQPMRGRSVWHPSDGAMLQRGSRRSVRLARCCWPSASLGWNARGDAVPNTAHKRRSSLRGSGRTAVNERRWSC